MLKFEDLENLRETAHYDTAKRQVRAPLLEAFDVYKSNINYGIEDESVEQKAEIIAWYRALLDLDETALEHVPQSIQKYVKVR